MSSVTVIIPTWDRERALSVAETLFRHADSLRTQVIILTTSDVPEQNHVDLLMAKGGYHRRGGPLTRQALLPVPAMQVGTLAAEPFASEGEVYLFLHDDVTLVENDWDALLVEHFRAPNAGLAGFGGALGFADGDIYLTPYDLNQLKRHEFVSNMREAETHGLREQVPMRVAALDGFALAIPRSVLERIGGWAACASAGIHFHMYDAWLSCRVQQAGWQVWMLPFQCHHAGGGTSVGSNVQYENAVRRLGYANGQDLFERAHERIYESFRGLLPIRVR